MIPEKLTVGLRALLVPAFLWLLVLDSEIFKDTAARVQFINGVLPSWKKDLCKVGFRTVKLRRGSTFELGQDYSLGCETL